MRAMRTGKIARVEELTRIPADVQDTLITILSEKTLPIPELDAEVQAVKGFNVIATANDRDRGVNELSTRAAAPLQHRRAAAARQRRGGGRHRLAAASRRLGRALELPAEPRALDEIRRVVTIFRELRDGVTGRRQDQAQVAQRHAVHRRGDLGRDQRPGAGRPLRRRRAARRPTWPPASGAPSSRTRSPTRWSGGSTWRRWSGSATAGRTSTARPGTPNDAFSLFGIRHHGPGSARALGRRAGRARSPTWCWSRGRRRPTSWSRWPAHEEMRAAGGAAGLRARRRAEGGRVLAVRRLLARVAGASGTASQAGVPVRFCDLPGRVQPGPRRRGHSPENGRTRAHPTGGSAGGARPRPPATTTPNAGGTTWSSTAATASPAVRGDRRGDDRGAGEAVDAGPIRQRPGARGLHAPRCCGPRSRRGTNGSPWSAAPGTCRR